MTDITTKLRSGEFTGSAAKIERLEWSEHDGMIPVSDGDYVRATDHDATIAAKANEIDRLRAEVAGKDAEIAELRDEVAMFCGYDNAKEMDAHRAADASRHLLTEGK